MIILKWEVALIVQPWPAEHSRSSLSAVSRHRKEPMPYPNVCTYVLDVWWISEGYCARTEKLPRFFFKSLRNHFSTPPCKNATVCKIFQDPSPLKPMSSTNGGSKNDIFKKQTIYFVWKLNFKLIRHIKVICAMKTDDLVRGVLRGPSPVVIDFPKKFSPKKTLSTPKGWKKNFRSKFLSS